jgi:hypothetical protein
MVNRGANQVAQVLIKWSELPEDLATWEDYEALKQSFLEAPAWGQATPQGRENVTTADPSHAPAPDLCIDPR